MRWTHWLLLLCLTTAMSAMASDNATVLLPSDLDTRMLPSGALDDPQPDTLLYDNNAPAALITSQNFYARVRFTPQVDFSIISCYLLTIDGNSVDPACSAFVYTATPAPGGEQGYAIFNAPFPEFEFMDRNFNDTIDVAGGQDFYVVFGPIPGGTQGNGHWNPVYDNAPTASRSSFATTGRFGTYTAANGDWMIRVGGISGGVFTDLAAGDLYNDVNGEPKFNFHLGEEVALNQMIENIGTQAATAYVAEFSVTGPGGTEVFSEDFVGTNLDPGALIVASTAAFTPDAEGEYVASCNVLADGDDNADNNMSYLRFFVGGNGRWYRYDDDEGADSYTGFSAGNGWALKLEPDEWPARLTSIRIDLGGSGTGNFMIWMNDLNGLPTFPTVWTGTPAVVQGWNEIPITPPIDLFDGQGITFGYLFQTGINMGYDTDPPNCADIPQMDTIAYQLANSGNSIFFDDGGNLCIQAFFDSSSASNPNPVVATNTDTIDFGHWNPAWPPATRTLTIYNEGSEDPLVVSNVAVSPPNVTPAYDIEPTSFTIPAGGSHDVTVTFDPPIHRSWPGLITIYSNAFNDTAYVVLLRGVGDTTATDDVNQIDLPLPAEFSLGQNYPNPFNPSTEIQFSLPVQSNVRLTIVNMLGQEVAVLASGRYSAGTYNATFDGANLPTGLYFYRLDAGDFTSVRKMMLLK
ncbi:MAG: T9SS type A sorting domain-containing protein [Calditrichaeota bacterium]|nr:T9SS type A sorting domain-containing protein [Calditrichota bacterium]MCB9367823.1 T9SS type A sorting domain-containing protein [Calditrichota bacterium]